MWGGHLYCCYEKYIGYDGRATFSNSGYGDGLLAYLPYWRVVSFAGREPVMGCYCGRSDYAGVRASWRPFRVEGELVA